MFDLFKSEYQRYQLFAWGICLLQLVLWSTFSKFFSVVEPQSELHLFIILGGVAVGVLFGLVSVSLHRRKNHWIYLMHRPLSKGRIYFALSLAGALLLFIAFILPFLVNVLIADVTTQQVVEARHYTNVVHAFLVMLCGYTLGQFIALANNKLAIGVLFSLTYLILRRQESVLYFLLLDSMFLLFSGYLAYASFRVNLAAEQTSKRFIAIAVLFIQPVAVVGLISLKAFYYHIPLSLTSQQYDFAKPLHELETQGQFDYELLRKHTDLEVMQWLARDIEQPLGDTIQRQLKLAKTNTLSRAHFYKPQPKHGFYLHTRHSQFALETDTTKWVFSHSDMLFVGIDRQTGERVGFLGRTGFVDQASQLTESNKFADVAVAIQTNTHYVQTKNKLYQVDFENKRIDLKFALTGSEEHFTSTPVPMFDVIFMSSNQRVYLFNKVKFVDSLGGLAPIKRVSLDFAHPVSPEFVMAEVMDGYVLMMHDGNLFAALKAGAQLIYLPHEGDNITLVSKEVQLSALPDWLHQQKLMFSPLVLNIVDNFVHSTLMFNSEPSKGEGFIWQRPIDLSFAFLIIFGCLLSVAAIFFLGKKAQLDNKTHKFWLLIALVTGPTALIAFLILMPWPKLQGLIKRESAT